MLRQNTKGEIWLLYTERVVWPLDTGERYRCHKEVVCRQILKGRSGCSNEGLLLGSIIKDHYILCAFVC